MSDKEQILQTLKEHRKELEERYSIRKIGIFGSYAKGCADESSDIDIYAEFDTPKFRNITGAWNKLENLLGKKVDMFYPHKNMRESLYQNIQREVVFKTW